MKQLQRLLTLLEKSQLPIITKKINHRLEILNSKIMDSEEKNEFYDLKILKRNLENFK